MIEFIVQPQRSNGHCFEPCEIHRATSFAVVRVDKVVRAGKRVTISRVIGRYSTKTEANGMAEANRKSFARPPAHTVRKLGRRIIGNRYG